MSQLTKIQTRARWISLYVIAIIILLPAAIIVSRIGLAHDSKEKIPARPSPDDPKTYVETPEDRAHHANMRIWQDQGYSHDAADTLANEYEDLLKQGYSQEQALQEVERLRKGCYMQCLQEAALGVGATQERGLEDMQKFGKMTRSQAESEARTFRIGAGFPDR